MQALEFVATLLLCVLAGVTLGLGAADVTRGNGALHGALGLVGLGGMVASLAWRMLSGRSDCDPDSSDPPDG